MAKDNDTKTEAEAPKTITPGQLAEEIGQDPKRVRAYLRTEFTRPDAEKNTSWALNAKTADAVRDHFTAADDESDEEELELDEDEA